ncbi:hypothetical protein RMATCC62417_07344 [Rhizopus microsporus]|nr:hypothetical protein RMATCC62417_07344 [Rhizopus microsporus]
MTFLPAMHERAHTLVLKFILRTHFLPEDTLLHTIRSFTETAPQYRRFRWPALLCANPIWRDPQYNGATTTVEDRLAYYIPSKNLRQAILDYRARSLRLMRASSLPPVLLCACRG